MSQMDFILDAPGLLRVEALQITMQFQRTGPNTGRVSWNIPTPAAGCKAGTQAYCGMVVVLTTKPSTMDNVPVDGTVYSSDPTGDPLLHAGDKINGAFVVGAFYNDRATVEFDISGLSPNTPYYITGYPTDCEYRYFRSGVHSYSMAVEQKGSDSKSGTQLIKFNNVRFGDQLGPNALKPTDQTGLVPGIKYNFIVQVGNNPVIPMGRPVNLDDCVTLAQSANIEIDGAKVSTYQDLVNELNRAFAKVMTGVQVSPVPPNAGGFYFQEETGILYQWDGHQNIRIPVLVSATDPTNREEGAYWYDEETDELKRWDGFSWVVVDVIDSPVDVLKPTTKNFWFDGTHAWHWNGNTWCQRPTIISETPPNIAQTPAEGTFWFDESTGVLNYWNTTLGIWMATTAIQSTIDPNHLPMGSYWFDERTNVLNVRTGTDEWQEAENYNVSEVAPTTPAVGKLWYKPSTLQLFQYDGTTWIEQDVIPFYGDPTDRASCDVWWNIETDELFQWDLADDQWVKVEHFYQQPTDPNENPELPEGLMWYEPNSKKLYEWDGRCFNEVEYVYWPSKPGTSIPDGTVWKRPDGKWFVKDGNRWKLIVVVHSKDDPYNLPAGAFWYNSVFKTLNMWNGVGWVNVIFSTVPLVPTIGTLWYDQTRDVLMKWDGSQWVPERPRLTAEFDCHNNIILTDNTTGNASMVAVLQHQGDKICHDLWASLDHPPEIQNPIPGSDGVSDKPSYLEEGVGTDGTDTDRKQLMNDIRTDLGYPLVGTELTQAHLDLCITKTLETMRQRSSATVLHGYMPLRIMANTQRYTLADRATGLNRIVDVISVRRITSAFLSTAHGAGIYGQIILQQLYHMGTYDLTSHFMMSNYISEMEKMLATRITFNWNESTRELWMHNRFPYNERMALMEVTVERTEQEIFLDRRLRPSIRKMAGGYARMQLAEIRGKFATLPSASGGTSLNSADLRTQGKEDIESAIDDIESLLADSPESYGRYAITWG